MSWDAGGYEGQCTRRLKMFRKRKLRLIIQLLEHYELCKLYFNFVPKLNFISQDVVSPTLPSIYHEILSVSMVDGYKVN